MNVAVFRSGAANAGRTIEYQGGQFSIDGFPVSLEYILRWDSAGELGWTYDGLSEWVHSLAVPVAPPISQPTTVPAAPPTAMPPVPSPAATPAWPPTPEPRAAAPAPPAPQATAPAAPPAPQPTAAPPAQPVAQPTAVQTGPPAPPAPAAPPTPQWTAAPPAPPVTVRQTSERTRKVPKRLLVVGVAVVVLLLVVVALAIVATRPPAVIHFSAANSKYKTLQVALDKIKKGGTIDVAPGTYLVASPLEVTRPVHIVGFGSGTTTIKGAASGGVLVCTTDGACSLSGLSFVHSAQANANTVLIARGQIAVTDVSFTGAVGNGTNGGYGLCLEAASRGTVTDCTADANQFAGFFVSSGSAVSVSGCEADANGSQGIVISNAAQPSAGSGATQADVPLVSPVLVSDVSGGPAPVLSKNTCAKNKTDGILVSAGQPTLQDNQCLNNAVGMQVENDAAPMIDGNNCSNNSRCGINYWDASAGTASDNTSEHNAWSGIAVGGSAHPSVSTNTGHANGVGLWYYQNSYGTADHNTFTGSVRQGIEVTDRARPSLDANVCTGSKQGTGITYADAASGVARANVCHDNWSGLYVAGNAHPLVVSNQCNLNSTFGIDISDRSSPKVLDNQCGGNRLGIMVRKEAQPQLRGNRTPGNSYCGVFDIRHVTLASYMGVLGLAQFLDSHGITLK